MSTDIAKTSKKIRFLVSSVLVRTVIYSGFMAGILASFYNFQLNTIKISSSSKSWAAQEYMAAINKAQQAYYAKNNKFSDSLEWLGVQGLDKDNYKAQIQSSLMKPVQTLENKREPAQFESAIAIAIPMDSFGEREKEYGAVYIGAVFAFQFEDIRNQLTTISAICQSEPEKEGYPSNPMQPTFDGTEIHCPPGTTILR